MRQPYNPFNLADGGPVDPRLGPPGVDTIPAVADGTPINLDGGEYVLPADTTMQLGPEFLDQLVAATHTPVANGPGFANGGWLSGIFGGVPRDRAAQIDAAVDQAGAPSGPAPAPVAPVAPAVDEMAELEALQERNRQMMQQLSRRPGYADGGMLMPFGMPRKRGYADGGMPDYADMRAEMTPSQKVLADNIRTAEMRAPRSDLAYSVGHAIQPLMPSMGNSLQKIGSGMQMGAGDYIAPAIEGAMYAAPLGAASRGIAANSMAGVPGRRAAAAGEELGPWARARAVAAERAAAEPGFEPALQLPRSPVRLAQESGTDEAVLLNAEARKQAPARIAGQAPVGEQGQNAIRAALEWMQGVDPAGLQAMVNTSMPRFMAREFEIMQGLNQQPGAAQGYANGGVLPQQTGSIMPTQRRGAQIENQLDAILGGATAPVQRPAQRPAQPQPQSQPQIRPYVPPPAPTSEELAAKYGMRTGKFGAILNAIGL